MTSYKEQQQRRKQLLTELKQFVTDHHEHRIGHLNDVHLSPDRTIRLSRGWLSGGDPVGCYPIAGVTAAVEQAGGVSAGSRVTLTRSLVPGLHSGQKQTTTDTREAWLIVSGPTFQWQISVFAQGLAASLGVNSARQFAAKINGAAARAGGLPQQPGHAPGGADELVNLAELHSRGMLTREEFEVAKRRLLGMG